MPRPDMQFASPARSLACLALLALATSAQAVPHEVAVGPANPPMRLDAAVWRLAAGGAEMAPYDPVTFVGPPVPLAILFAPVFPTGSAGMRIEREAPLVPTGPAAPAPPAEPLTRWADIFTRLVPVRRADGSLFLDLTGVTMVDAHAWCDARGVHWSDGDAPALGGDR